mgnify:FL=1
MKRNAMTTCLLLAAGMSVCAQTPTDSLQIQMLQEVEIMATRATTATPVAYTNVTSEQLEKQNHGQDLPYLLSMTPSAITTSDAGAGIGYTTLRVRGTDATRINVTANGIPMNDAESHNVFWVNMPDLASSLKDVQLQRGVGTSTNGAGAFGASMNMQTGRHTVEPYASITASAGSFGTMKQTLKLGTGLLNDHWAVDARLSNISTDGYIDRASVNLNSYYLQTGYYTGNTSLRLILIGGQEETYHAWNYASKEEMAEYGRRYNSCGYMFTDENGVDHYYDDQTDNYVQKHAWLLLNHNFDNNWNMNVGLHYTKGDGYYQEYKTDRWLPEYGLEGDDTDLVRKKAMDNDFYGGIFSLTYRNERINATLGGGWNRYEGDHFGRILWIKNYVGDLNPDQDYYRNTGTKQDGNIYLKAIYNLGRGVSAYADMQYRHISYQIKGENDKYDWTKQPAGMQQLAVDETFDFLNPKIGLNWQINDAHRAYASLGIAHKEPTRNNYTDGKFRIHPKAERLTDYELGYAFANKAWNVGVNLYYMDYKDQLVLTGELNEIGEPLAANMPESYRMGVELMAAWQVTPQFGWNANASLSRNRIKDFTETLYENEDPSGDVWQTNLGDTHIAFSPDVILNNQFVYNYKGWEASLHSQYVGKQYMSNLDCDAHILDAYFVSNLSVSYSFALPKIKQVTIGCTVYNLFNEEYENNGYAGSGFYYDGDQKVRYDYAGYAAQAGTNFLAHLSLTF